MSPERQFVVTDMQWGGDRKMAPALSSALISVVMSGHLRIAEYSNNLCLLPSVGR